MAATFFLSQQSMLDSSGDPISGALLYTYAESTTTPLAAYSDEALTTAHANPIVADANGRFGNIYLQALAYKFVLKSAAGVTIWTMDNFNPDGGTVTLAAVTDSVFSVVDDGDTSKAGKFQLSGVTTGNTRTITWPDFDGTMATVAGTETLTNKTFRLASNTLTGTTAQFNTALSDGSFATLAGTEALTNKTLTSPVLNGTLTGTAFLNEDDMASDSATKLASQQSIKAYFDNATVADYTAAKALAAGVYSSIWIEDASRGGMFVWRSGDQSASITADPSEGVWVPPSSDATGASGAWQRIITDDRYQLLWFDVDVTGATNNWTELSNAVALASGKTLCIPKGTIKATVPNASATITPGAGTRIQGAGFGSLIAFDGAVSTTAKIWTLSNDNITFSDIKLTSSIIDSLCAMFDPQGTRLVFDRIRVEMGQTTARIGGVALLFSASGDSSHVTFTNSEFTACRYAFVRANATTNAHSKYIFTGCRFWDNCAGNITFNAASGPCDDVIISDCYFGDLFGGDNTNFGSDPGSIKSTESLAIGLGSVRSAVLNNLIFDGEMAECIHLEEKNKDIQISNVVASVVRRAVCTDQTERVIGMSANNVAAGGSSAYPFEVPTNIRISNVVAELKDYVDLDADATTTMPNGGTVANLYDDDQHTTADTTAGISTTNPYVVAHVDLGASTLITYIEVENLYLSAGSSTAFQLQYSTDNITFTSLGRSLSITTNGKSFRRIASVSARYWRVARIGATDLTTSVASIGQLRLQRGKAGRDGVGSIYQSSLPYGTLLDPNAKNVEISNVSVSGWDVGFQKGSERNMRIADCSAFSCGIGFEGKRYNPADKNNRAVECKTGGVNFLPGIITGWSFVDCGVLWAPDAASTNNRMMIKDFHVEVQDFTIPASTTVDLVMMPRGIKARGGAENLQISVVKENSSNNTAAHKEVTRTFNWDGSAMTDSAIDNAGSGAFSFTSMINNSTDDTFDMRFTDSSGSDQTGFVVSAHFSGCLTVDE